jgi:hypothetical protein
MNLLQNLLDRAAADRKKLGIKTEMERILELPREELEERGTFYAEKWTKVSTAGRTDRTTGQRRCR